MKAVAYPQWKGFELLPEGCLLEQFIDLSGAMGIAYERCVEFYKDFHTHDRLMLVFPRGASSMEVRSLRPRGCFRIDNASLLVVPKDLEHDDEGTSAIYDTLALYPTDTLIRSVAQELKLQFGTMEVFHEKCRKLPRTAWLEQLLQEYFYERVLSRSRIGEREMFLEREIVRELLKQFFRLKEISHADIDSEGATATKAVRYIESNLFSPINSAEICKTIGASESDLLRKFKAATKTTPYNYIKNRRLEEARKLLESTEHPVGDIALLVGYNNFGAFSDAFRAKFGLPPSRYRDAPIKSNPRKLIR